MNADVSEVNGQSVQKTQGEQKTLSAARLALAVKRAYAAAGEVEDLIGSEPIAIVGMGCRFPGGVTNPQGYWQLLEEGRSGIRMMPEGRWSGARERMPAHLLMGGYLESVDLFDPEFFGIAPKEAHSIDPQQRLMLEVCWEAIADAGMSAKSLTDSNTGVFAAIYSSDYLRMQLDEDAAADSHTGVGAAHSVAAGRLSFLLNLRGPSMAVDTACSSSLVATHLACQSLRRRESDAALVGASSLKLLPDEVRAFEQWGMLASDGRAKAFDAAADGFVPGEGAAVLVLKRLSDAIADGDGIRGVIRGTAVNHDGRSSVLTAPRGPAQEAVIRAALRNAQVNAGDISYIETHGTGTSLGDPIEVEALDAVYGMADSNGSRKEEGLEVPGHPVFLGAVKTNLGHLEATAGLAGLIKVVLAMEHDRIPQNLNFSRQNPKIVLGAGSRLRFLADAVDWPRMRGPGATPRFAGVSAFGLGGTNAHVVVEEAPRLPVAGRAPLPSPEWNRQRYWLADKVDERTSVDQVEEHNLLGREISTAFVEGMCWERELSSKHPSWAGDHCWEGEPIWPLAAWLEMARQAGAAMLLRSKMAGEVHIRNFAVHRRLSLSREPVRLQSLASPSGEVKFAAFVDGGWQWFASGYWEARAKDSGVDSMTLGPGGAWPSTAGLATAGLNAVGLDVEGLEQRASSVVSAHEVYVGLAQNGLTYGGTFRALERVFVGTDYVLGQIAATETAQMAVSTGAKDEDSLQSALMNPAPLSPPLLDACLQTVQVALGSACAAAGYLPMSVRSYSVSGRGAAAYALVRTVSEAGADVEVDVTISDRVGKLIAQISGLGLRRVAGLQRMAPRMRVRWTADDSGRSAEGLKADSEKAAWVIWDEDEGEFAGGHAAHRWAEAHLPSLVAQLSLRNRVKVLSKKNWHPDAILDGKSNAFLVAGSLRSVTAKLLEIVGFERVSPGTLSQLIVITCGAVGVIAGEPVDPEQAAILGMVRSLRAEYPMVVVRLIDLPSRSAGPMQLLVEYLLRAGEESRSEEVALRHGMVFRPTLQAFELDPTPHGAQELKIGRPGLLDSLHAHDCRVEAPGRGEIQIECRAHGLNFRDVLMALGNYAGASAALGAECAGIVTECGEDTRFKTGDAVVAFAPASLKSIVNVPASFAFKMPEGMSFAEAATIPVSLLTAHFGFSRLARLTAGQTVLVHSAAGGLGHAALQLARLCGAEVIATAGSEEKRRYLRERGIEHVFDSRSESFAEDVLSATGGRGVDAVLNSLTGAMIAAGLRTLREGGVFLEVGKREIWSPERMAEVRPDVRYFSYDLGEQALRQPALMAAMWGELSADFTSGRLLPLPFDAYGIDEARDAFRRMASGRHIGKVVLLREPQHPQPQLKRAIDQTWAERWKQALHSGTVLITGGTGALGLETVRWLIAQGARSLVLLSRGGETSAVQALIRETSAKNVRIVAEAADVANGDQMKQAIMRLGGGDMAPLRVVVHAAGEVEDGLLQSQTMQSMQNALRTKVEGARLLDELTRDHSLLVTVYYSSIAALAGSAGQAGYAAANAFLDGLAEERAARGLYTISVDWGAWTGDGMAGDLSVEMKARMGRQGIQPMAASAALAALEASLIAGQTRAVIANVDWARFAMQFPTGSRAGEYFERFTSFLTAREGSSGFGSEAHGVKSKGMKEVPSGSVARMEIESIRSALRSDRQAMMEQLVRTAARRVLGLSESRNILADSPLQDLGLDSLMSLELRNVLAHAMNHPLSATLLFDYPTIRQVSGYLVSLLQGDDGKINSGDDRFALPESDRSLDSTLIYMTDEQAEELLIAELEEKRG